MVRVKDIPDHCQEPLFSQTTSNKSSASPCSLLAVQMHAASHDHFYTPERIPFAENSNPPGASSSKGAPPSAFKTPGRPAAQVVSKKSVPKSAKSSPLYPNGDNINLPEIATDSEDEDSDDDQTGGFRAPSWVASPALRDLLTQQQLVDPESIFGPIAPLQMEEVFRNSKNPERLKKFRERGSSARWVDTGDAVTKEEKVKDREMRARVVKEGGWRFGQDA